VTDHLPGTTDVPAVHAGRHRDLRLDACRGLALWFIFIDHIADDSLTWLTPRNYGFSDTSEVFVFVSGYTCMLAYGGALREQGWRTTAVRALRRAWEIYAAFLVLLIVYFALVWIIGGGHRYLDETNTGVFFRAPRRGDRSRRGLAVCAGQHRYPAHLRDPASDLSGAAMADDPKRLGYAWPVVSALHDGPALQLASAGMAERRALFQSVRVAVSVRHRRLVRL
jgi:hypothetical protein